MKIICLIVILTIFASCTLSIMLIHTEGKSSDVVDETDAPTANVTANMSLMPL